MDSISNFDPMEQIVASPVPFDLYREVHKGLRHALFELTVAVGAADCERADVRHAVVEQVQALVTLLHTHHGHEDDFIQALIAAHDAQLAAAVDAGHIETEADIAELTLRAEKLSGSSGGEAVAFGLDLYGHLAGFTARYLTHMAVEEGAVMTTLRESMSLQELFDVEVALRTSIAPPTMCAFIAMMLPAMNPTERVAMLGGMRAGAPPEVFELFRTAAEAALEPTDYRSLVTSIGIAEEAP